jgi:hypothetical protein
MFEPVTVEQMDVNTGEMAKSQSTPFQMSMRSIKSFLASKIIAAPNHSVGMVFYNTV